MSEKSFLYLAMLFPFIRMLAIKSFSRNALSLVIYVHYKSFMFLCLMHWLELVLLNNRTNRFGFINLIRFPRINLRDELEFVVEINKFLLLWFFDLILYLTLSILFLVLLNLSSISWGKSLYPLIPSLFLLDLRWATGDY